MPTLSDVGRRAALEARSAAVMARAGLIAPGLPHRQVAMGPRRCPAFGAFRRPGRRPPRSAFPATRPALRDERGTLTWWQLDQAHERGRQRAAAPRDPRR